MDIMMMMIELLLTFLMPVKNNEPRAQLFPLFSERRKNNDISNKRATERAGVG